MLSKNKQSKESGLLDFLGTYKPQPFHGGQAPDTLQDRLRLLIQQPLPDLGHQLATAYAATDSANNGRSVYALVLDRAMPYRLKIAEVFSNINHPNIQPLLGYGTVLLSSTNQWHQVLFLERLNGPRASDLRAAGKKMHEHQVIDRILSPMLRALIQYRDKGLIHGSINLHTIIMGEETTLMESASSPCAYFQDYLYEPLERIMADQCARGVADQCADVYAVAIVAFELIYGIDHLRKLSREEFVDRALEIGTYHLFSQNIDLSDNMADFFRGAMSENIEERWDIEHLQQWLGGKRYNMIVPPTPRDATRPLQFMGKDFFSKRALAHAFHKNWRTTMKEIRDIRLDRWFEMSMHQPDMADRVERVLRIGGSGSSEKINTDMLTRLISLLDPIGPIRTPHYSLRPEGIGIALADLFRSGLPPETHEVTDLIDFDTPNYWGYLTEHTKSPELSQALWLLQRVKTFLKIRGLGFGIERVLYELNPNLPCQSETIKSFNALTIKETLGAMDAVAVTHGKDSSLVDRHIIAFLACKLDIGKEIKIQDVAMLDELAGNQELIAIRILGRAQQKNDKEKYVGLASWAALRVEIMLIHIHNRTLRAKLISKLRPAAASGDMNEVLSILVNREIIQADQQGFARALAQHKQNQRMINDLRNPKLLQRLSLVLGSRISSVVGYGVLISSLYYIAKFLKS